MFSTSGTPLCNASVINGAAISCAAAGLSDATGTAYTHVYSTYTGGGACTQAPAPGYDVSGCTISSVVLSNGVPITGIALAAGADSIHTITLPAGASNVTFKTSGGSGDVDLYVKLGSAPTTSSYLQKSDGSSTAESISLTNPAAGTYYVLVHGYAASSSGVSLVATYSTVTPPPTTVLTNGVPVTGINVAKGASAVYTLVVPAGRPSLSFSTSGGSGDSDLYVQLGSAPTTASYLKRSIGSTTAETVTISAPAAGTYYVMVYGYAATSGVTLVGND
ncbi:MAG: PPC domain-containing protein [Pseudomonadota bacterium]